MDASYFVMLMAYLKLTRYLLGCAGITGFMWQQWMDYCSQRYGYLIY